MLTAKTPITPSKPEGRKPLQPKNIILSEPPTIKLSKPTKDNHAPIISFTPSNKENAPVFALPIDASLAEELSAVRQKLERLRLDRERTEKMLMERTRVLDLQMIEMEERGEFQKELEIEVDRLYRLKELKLACLRRSPIRSLREREMEKKNKDAQSEVVKVGEGKEQLPDESNTTGSPTTSFESSSASTSASTSNSTCTSNSTLIPSRKSPIPLRLSLESACDK